MSTDKSWDSTRKVDPPSAKQESRVRVTRNALKSMLSKASERRRSTGAYRKATKHYPSLATRKSKRKAQRLARRAMRASAAMLLLGLAGCGNAVSYEVVHPCGLGGVTAQTMQAWEDGKCTPQVVWTCGSWHRNVAMCATKEECTKICQDRASN